MHLGGSWNVEETSGGENSCFGSHGHILNDCYAFDIIVVTQEYSVKRTKD